jgi:hypothetical protein
MIPLFYQFFTSQTAQEARRNGVLMENQAARSYRRRLYSERINLLIDVKYINVNIELFLDIARVTHVRKEVEY